MSVDVGMRFTTNEGCTIEVIDYINSQNVLVEFVETGNTMNVRAGNIKSGNIKNKMHRSVFGVGCIGMGPHRPSIKGVYSREYKYWFHMLRRCYSNSNAASSKNYKERGVYVDSTWHNFQEFAEWCQWQPEFLNTGWELDKDVFSTGTSIKYSPETCVFVPIDINLLFKQTKAKGYNSRNQVIFKGKFVKTCESREEASQIYGDLKTKHLRQLAELYKDRMSSRLYDYLIEYQGFIVDV